MPDRVAIATCAEHRQLDGEGRLLLDALRELGVRAEPEVWTEQPAGGWAGYDLVVLRSTWDYTLMLARFRAWTQSLGARLLNTPGIVAWNADKRYLSDLAQAGLETIRSEYLPPGAPLRPPAGRFVLKPSVAAGSRGAAVFDGARHDAARAHLAALHAAGQGVLLQPYCEAVDGPEAETALVFLDGTLSHAMRKGPLLALDRPPPDGLFRAEQMSPACPAPDAVALGRRVHALVEQRFGRPLYARVDVLRDDSGTASVLELELIEPSLFLDYAPGSAQLLARAVVGRLAER
ncbi:MAG: hypothetical protein KY433_00035 [Actinobacteria bacterium]|nr:hypothetical protein [Actinomycetota bacterium]